MAKVISLLEKMGLVEVTRPGTPQPEPATAPAPAAPEVSEPVAVAAQPAKRLAPPGPPPRFEGSAADPDAAGGGEDFRLEDVYASAAIETPAHGFTVFKLIELMQSDELRGLDPATAAKVVTAMLRRLPTGAVEIDDIIRDAVLRDRALDAFEGFLAGRVEERAREVAEQNRVLQDEIDELTRKNAALMEANQEMVERERERLEAWRRRKVEEEERLFAAVQPFVESNPVSRSTAIPPAPTSRDDA